MKVLRMALLGAAGWYLWRVLQGRERQVLQRAKDAGRRFAGHDADRSVERGHHTSAASAANDDFRDDRDVTVGEQFTAVGMRPGAR